MRIDLHTHSNASDGTDSPAQLVTLAAGAGLDVVAITDHDGTRGWAEAAAARPEHLTLIRGAEFSTVLRAADGRMVSVHLLGYLFDPHHPGLVAEQARLREERLRRGIRIVENMMAAGIPITTQQVLDIAAGATVGRPHIGRALVESGVVGSVDEAFASLLAGPAGFNLPKRDTDLPTAVRMIAEAGGVSVLAHPRGRGEARALTAAVIADLTAAGLNGLEIDHPDHGPRERAELTRIAADNGLIVTGSSDYHGHNKKLIIGQETTAPEALTALIRASSGITEPLGPLAADFPRFRRVEQANVSGS